MTHNFVSALEDSYVAGRTPELPRASSVLGNCSTYCAPLVQGGGIPAGRFNEKTEDGTWDVEMAARKDAPSHDGSGDASVLSVPLQASDLAVSAVSAKADGNAEDKRRQEEEPIVMREASSTSAHKLSTSAPSTHQVPPLAVHNHQVYMAAVSAEASHFSPERKFVERSALNDEDAGRLLSESSRLACDALSMAEAARKSYCEWQEHAHHLNFILSKKKDVRQSIGLNDAATSSQPLHLQPWVGQQDGWSTYRYHPAGRDSVRPVSARPGSARNSISDIPTSRQRPRPASARASLGRRMGKPSPYAPNPIERILRENSTERRAGAAVVRGSGGSKIIPPPRRVRTWRETPVRNEAAASAAASWRRSKSAQVRPSMQLDSASVCIRNRVTRQTSFVSGVVCAARLTAVPVLWQSWADAADDIVKKYVGNTIDITAKEVLTLASDVMQG